jgi:hypothetical protein
MTTFHEQSLHAHMQDAWNTCFMFYWRTLKTQTERTDEQKWKFERLRKSFFKLLQHVSSTSFFNEFLQRASPWYTRRSGHSEGEFISLGHFEQQDLKATDRDSARSKLREGDDG